MDKAIIVLVLVSVSASLGGLGTYTYLLTQANTEWSNAVDRAKAATTEAIAAERRLAAAKSKRAEEARQLEEAANASGLADCPVDPVTAGLLDTSAAATRAD